MTAENFKKRRGSEIFLPCKRRREGGRRGNLKERSTIEEWETPDAINSLENPLDCVLKVKEEGQ